MQGPPRARGSCPDCLFSFLCRSDLQELLSQPDAHLVPGLRKGTKPQEDVKIAQEGDSALVTTHQSGQPPAAQGGQTVYLL